MINSIKEKLKTDKSFVNILLGSFYNIIASVVAIVLGMLFNLIIARYYGPEALGIYALVNTVLALVFIFALLGTNTVLLRLIPEHIVKYSHYSAYLIFLKIIKLVVIFSILSGFILYITSDYIANTLLNNETIEVLLKLSVYFIVFYALGIVGMATIRALNSVKIYALIQVLIPFSNIMILLLLTYFSYEDNNAVFAILISYIIVLIIIVCITYKMFKNKIDKKDNVKYISNSNILTISIPMFLTTAMTVIIMQVDILMIGAMLNVEMVGIYTIVAKIAVLSIFVTSAINTMVAPKFSELYYSNKHNELKNIAQKSTLLQIVVSFPIIIILYLSGEFLLSYFGEEFIKGYMALTILILGYTISSIAGPAEMFLNMTGNQKQLNIIIVVGSLVNVVLNYILIPIYGIEGAAIATLASLLVIKLSMMLFIRKKFGYFLTPNIIKVFR